MARVLKEGGSAVMGTRAVLRSIAPGGAEPLCGFCDQRCKFVAKKNPRQVICNIYENDHWDRTEHFHEECYDLAGEPHGPAIKSHVMLVNR